jgi:hypothetical protein
MCPKKESTTDRLKDRLDCYPKLPVRVHRLDLEKNAGRCGIITHLVSSSCNRRYTQPRTTTSSTVIPNLKIRAQQLERLFSPSGSSLCHSTSLIQPCLRIRRYLEQLRDSDSSRAILAGSLILGKLLQLAANAPLYSSYPRWVQIPVARLKSSVQLDWPMSPRTSVSTPST